MHERRPTSGKGPCKDCENKGCGSYHDRCEKYQEYKQKIEKAREKRELEYISRIPDEARVRLPNKSGIRDVLGGKNEKHRTKR